VIKRAKWRVPAVLSAGAILAAGLAGCGAKNGGTSGTVASGDATVATVNGDEIDREEMHRFLEATHGEEALGQLIEFQLVMQELKKQGMSITDEEVKAAIAQRAQQNPAIAADIERVNKNGGPMSEALQRNVRYQLAIDKLLTKDIKADEATLKSWYEKNRSRYGTPARVKLGILITSTKARADTLAQQLKNKTKTFAQLVEEQKKANDPAAKGSVAEDPRNPWFTVEDLPPAIKPHVAKLKPGQVSPVLNLGTVPHAPGTTPHQMFGIVRLSSREEAKAPKFEEIRDRVEREYKLEQVARGVVKENPKNPSYEQYVQQLELAQQNSQQGRMSRPSYREILNFINQAAVSRLTTKLHRQAQVQIPDAMYERVAKEFQPTPAAPATSGAATTPGAATAPGGTTSGASNSAAGSASNAASSTPSASGQAATPAPKR
jgi:parvulin-like peptidyl-prolyl isomerase